MSRKGEVGQTLIEVLIALSIAVIVIGALAIATIVSIRNSQFSQNQTQATKLAQEGLEMVRAIRNRDGVITSADPRFSNGRFSDIWTIQFNGCGWNKVTQSCTVGFQGFFRLDPNNLQLVHTDSTTTANDLTASIFKRITLIEDDATYSYQKRVSVIVSWADSSGTHESNLQTLLTDQ